MRALAKTICAQHLPNKSQRSAQGDIYFSLMKLMLLLLFTAFLFLPFYHVVPLSFQSTVARPEIATGEFTWINYLNIFN